MLIHIVIQGHIVDPLYHLPSPAIPTRIFPAIARLKEKWCCIAVWNRAVGKCTSSPRVFLQRFRQLLYVSYERPDVCVRRWRRVIFFVDCFSVDSPVSLWKPVRMSRFRSSGSSLVTSSSKEKWPRSTHWSAATAGISFDKDAIQKVASDCKAFETPGFSEVSPAE